MVIGTQELPFDDTIWDVYETTMAEVTTRPKVVKKLKDDAVLKCKEYLFSKQGIPVTFRPQPASDFTVESLRSSSQQQGLQFRLRYNFTQQEFDFITRCLVYIGDSCAKQLYRQVENDMQQPNVHQFPIVVAWYKLKEIGWLPRENCLSTYMYILGSSIGSSTITPAPNLTVCDDTLLEVVTCHDLIHRPNEKTVTIRLKSLIGKGEIQQAEQLLASLFADDEDNGDKDNYNNKEKKKNEKDTSQNGLRLRTFLPLVEHYCQIGDAESILRLYREMHDAPGVHWDVDAYILVLSSLARFGYFGMPSSNGDRYGPELFHQIATDMTRDLLELTPEAADVLEVAVRDGFRDGTKDISETIGRVKIPSNGTCPKTGVPLRLLALDETQREHVHDTLLEMARLSCQEFAASVRQRSMSVGDPNLSNKNLVAEDHGFESLSNFSKWLE
jgi:hypothetical protein